MSFLIPVSAKGILINSEGKVLLLKNDRNTWELPGGRLEPGEQPEQALVREIEEELGIAVIVRQLVDVWLYEVIEHRFVLIVSYECEFDDNPKLSLSEEHLDYGWFHISELNKYEVADGYKRAIQKVRGTGR